MLILYGHVSRKRWLKRYPTRHCCLNGRWVQWWATSDHFVGFFVFCLVRNPNRCICTEESLYILYIHGMLLLMFVNSIHFFVVQVAGQCFISFIEYWYTRKIHSTKSSRYIPIYRQFNPALFGKQGPLLCHYQYQTWILWCKGWNRKSCGPHSGQSKVASEYGISSCYTLSLLMNKILQHQKYLIDNPELSMYGVYLPTLTIKKHHT